MPVNRNWFSEFSTEEHWRYFVEFCKWEQLSGGPDPHLVTTAELAKDQSWLERVWRGGCYAGVYNVPAGEFIWQAWPYTRVLQVSQLDLVGWLSERWLNIITRRERRCVRTPEQLGRFLFEYSRWMSSQLTEKDKFGRYGNYDALWDDIGRVYTAGRYFKIKLLEYFHRACALEHAMPDIRPIGGENPRRAFALLMPEESATLLDRENSSKTIARIAELVVYAHQELLERHCALDNFRLQVLLCDYKQSYLGQRQYPGRSLDSEISYYEYVSRDNLGYAEQSEVYAARRKLFPLVGLGELRGWSGVRKELGTVLRRFEYTWSDQLYDYVNIGNLSKPTRWDDGTNMSSVSCSRQKKRCFGLLSDNVLGELKSRNKSKNNGARQSMSTGVKKVWTIIPNLIYQRGDLSRFSSDEKDAFVRHYNVCVIVNLYGRPDTVLEHWQDIRYVHHPIADGKSVDYGALMLLSDDVLQYAKINNGAILVLCHAGRNRSGLFSSLLVRLHTKVDGGIALERVRKARPRAVANIHFEQFLLSLGAL